MNGCVETKRNEVVTSRDRKRYARARARGEALEQEPSGVVSARYDENRDGIELTFRGGALMAIPRRMIPGLESAAKPTLNAIHVSPAGDALSWPALDVDVYVPGLVERAFGHRLFAEATGRLGMDQGPKAKVPTTKPRISSGQTGRPRKRSPT